MHTDTTANATYAPNRAGRRLEAAHARRSVDAAEPVARQSLPDGMTPALNTREAAAYLGLAESTLEKLRVYGGSPRFVKISRKAVRYRLADLDRWMSDRTVGSTSEAVAA